MKFTAASTTPVMKAAIQENSTASMMTLIICPIPYHALAQLWPKDMVFQAL